MVISQKEPEADGDPRAVEELAGKVFVGIPEHVRLWIGEAEADLVEVAEHLGDVFVFLAFGFPEHGGAEIETLEQPLEVVLAGVAQGAGLDVPELGLEGLLVVFGHKNWISDAPTLAAGVGQIGGYAQKI